MIERILEDTKKSVTQRRAALSQSALEGSVVKTKRSLAKSLKMNRSAVILECKKASPSQGIIRPNFDIADIIKAYDPFADAISVITNAAFFNGSLEFLTQARKYTNKPLLCKDFILTPYQVLEARHHDADAVLLMMSLLSDDEFRACFESAASLNMDVLVEVHDEPELERALALDAKIIGVNNRDFRTLKVDMMTAERLLPQIPNTKIKVFESGVSAHQHLQRYRTLADAFLIGTSLMREENLPRAVRELVFGRVKVCGLTRAEDAILAHESGAIYGGLIFAPESPRSVTLEQAMNIAKSSELSFVGVFVNQPVAMIVDYANKLSLCGVQLHGEEDATFIAQLREQLPKACEIWKAVRVQDEIPTPKDFGCDRVLLDAYHPDQRGGTGQRFSWDKLAKIAESEKYILSGGLSPENAREADAHGLWALDVNSGVESAAGVKNEKLVRAFFEELR